MPMVVTGYTSVDRMSHDAPAILEAANVLRIKVLESPTWNFAAQTLPDAGRCFCGRRLRDEDPNGIASGGCWAVLCGPVDTCDPLPFSAPELATAWRAFRF